MPSQTKDNTPVVHTEDDLFWHPNWPILDKLEARFNALQNKEPGTTDSLCQIARELKAIFKITMVQQSYWQKEHELLAKLSKAAKTAEEFYEISKIDAIHDYHGAMDRTNLLKAAQLGHPLAMRTTAGSILSGAHENLEEAIPWALRCIRYIEKVVIQQLQHATTESDRKTLEDLTAGLARARSRISAEYAGQKEIPAHDTDEFKRLVQELIAKREREGSPWPHPNKFTLSHTMFDSLVTRVDTPITATIAQEKADAPVVATIAQAKTDASVGATTIKKSPVNYSFMLDVLVAVAEIAATATMIAVGILFCCVGLPLTGIFLAGLGVAACAYSGYQAYNLFSNRARKAPETPNLEASTACEATAIAPGAP